MENRLLACLSAPDLALLTPHLRQVPLLHGAVLQEPERPVEWVYFPMSGAVSLLVVMKAGEAVEIATVGREGAIGLSAHSGPGRARTRAIVQVAGVAKAVAAPVLATTIGQSEDMRDVMVGYQGTLSAQSQRMAACNALHSVEERLARWLLQMSDRIEGAEIPITQDTLAHLLGVRRTTVTLVAHNLQGRGVIRYRRGHVVIASRRDLLALSCECYDACRQADELVQQANLALKASA